MTLVEPKTVPSGVRRGPGRPKGSKAQVVRDPRALGVHHFAFVRSSLLGLDLADAFDRYLAWSEPTSDFRYVQGRRDALLKQILEAGRHYDASQPSNGKITDLLNLLRGDVAPPKAAERPSLEEWAAAEGMDPDFYSEAELLAEYNAQFGLDNPDALADAEHVKDAVAQRVSALNHLETVLAVPPSPSDRLEAWFAKSVARCLRNVGLLTLDDLVRYINVYGHRWYGPIKGLGPKRAPLVVAWLEWEQERLNLLIAASVKEPKSKLELQRGSLVRAASADPAIAAQFGAESQAALSIERIRFTPETMGGDGVFCSRMPNSFSAQNDIDAVTGWLSTLDKAPLTQRSYRKEVERFLMWTAQELGKPLSSVTALDVQAYQTFLSKIPLSWIQARPMKRTDPAWRPFRAQPSPSSQKQALVILQTMFSRLVDAGYLVANPFRSLKKGFDLPASKIDIRRSFTEAEWSHILHCADNLPEGNEKVRLRCVLELLVSSGVRLSELSKARYGDLRLESIPGLPDTWVLTVTGKRKKTRQIPLKEEVVDLLHLHRVSCGHRHRTPKPSDDEPLIQTLNASVKRWSLNEDGVVALVSVTPGAGRPLSASAIYAMLKRFFKHAAKRIPGGSGLEPRRLLMASTHWARHTFVRQALVDGVPIEVASELAGHASIDTTSIYSTQELARKIAAVRAMRSRAIDTNIVLNPIS